MAWPLCLSSWPGDSRAGVLTPKDLCPGVGDFLHPVGSPHRALWTPRLTSPQRQRLSVGLRWLDAQT